MNRLLITASVLLLSSISWADEEIPPYLKAIPENTDKFEEIDIVEVSKLVDFEITLGETVMAVDGQQFDGFRFTAPPESDQLDLIWYFNVATNWSNWYLTPVEDTSKNSFKNWLNVIRLYDKFDQVQEPDRVRALQSLEKGYFVPGEEYVMWFRQRGEAEDNSLRGRIGFGQLPEDENWDFDNYEEQLALTPQPAAAQVEELGSRGGEIILDQTFFKPSEAEGIIDQLFFAIEMTSRYRGGYFVTVESTSCLVSHPNFAEIRAKYGDPDFTVSSAESVAKHNHNPYPHREDPREPEVDDAHTITYFYDYFGFVVDADDPEGALIDIRAQASNYAKLRQSTEGKSFGAVGMQNLMAFYDHGTEVGRIYYFNEGSKMPMIIQEPPVGRYQLGLDFLEYLGDGQWRVTSETSGDKLAHDISFRDHRRNGDATWYYENGQPRGIGQYEDGVLHGAFKIYNENGELTETRRYEKGKHIQDSDQTESGGD
ncbi:MAG: hypothetical protein AAFX93_09615 [Verrucomicrobiota bacterium]